MTNTRPKAPDHLSVEAVSEWHRVCDELEAVGRLDALDRAPLTLYVETWSLYQDAMAHVRKHGVIVKYANGVPGQSPFYKTSRELVTQMRGQLSDLGLPPLARAKLKPVEKEPAEQEGY